jgi:anaerobic selenocysteine-containing dehydrogenase
MKKVIHAACPHDCPDACGVLITVEDGRATRIEGDPAHPVTRGFLCAKVTQYLDRVYSPQRVLYPMRRVMPKGATGSALDGTSGFERITWDEALDEIASRFKSIIAEFGGEAILPYSYGGTLAVLSNASMDRRFFHRLGASQLNRTICSETGGEALKSVIGRKLGTEPEQFAHARLIIAWGANIHGNNIHLWPFIEEARRNGARLIVIDPYRTRTAACADWHLPINPGTDVALALGMMHVIIGEGLHDAEYVAQHTIGFDQLRQRVRDYAPEQVARWTGIAAGDIRRLAREYATVRPAVIRLNYGMQRCENGGMATRAVAMLPCITGSWKDVGGGLQLSTSGAFKLNRAALERPDLELGAPHLPAVGRCGTPHPARSINMVELGRELNERTDPPIKALFVYNSNPAVVCPNHNAVVRGLMRPDLFTVVHEQFLTDTCDYADIVLPATRFFEHKDLQTSYGHYYLQISEKAIEPLGECRSNVETFRALAERMGFEEPCFRESVGEMIDAAHARHTSFGCPALVSPGVGETGWGFKGGQMWGTGLKGIDRARLEREGHVRLNFGIGNAAFLPFANGGFLTSSGKAELYSEQLAAQGFDPVASFTPPVESRHGEKSEKYPLELLPRKADNFLNSTFSNLPSHQRMEKRDLLEISRADAAARGINDGDLVRVFNDRGEVTLRARVNADDAKGAVRPGVVGARLNWTKLSSGGQINALTSERLTDMGRGPTFYSTLVQVERRSAVVQHLT